MVYSKEPEPIIRVFELIYQYRFEEAEIRLNAIKPEEADPNLIDLTRVNLHWWYLISGDSSRDHEEILTELLESMILPFHGRSPSQLAPDDVFMLVHAHAYRTRVHIYGKRYIKGALVLRQMTDYLDHAIQRYNQFDKYAFLAGLYNYFAASAYDYYPLLRSFFALAPKHDKELGYRLLNDSRRLDHLLLRTEATYFLMKINLELEEDYPRASEFASHLIQQYPENPIYLLHLLMIQVNQNRIEEARKSYQTIMAISAVKPGLTQSQRLHIVREAERYLSRKKITLFI